MENHSINKLIAARPYNGAVENISENPASRHFFAAANGRDGFVSYFDEVFGGKDINRLYILGGGPGSGKSTMMKKTAALSEKKGYTTEHIHCSSSPYSLDGVIIKELGIAVIDGTAPHTYAPTVAGVREICIDPGRAWDTKSLSSPERAEKIIALSQEKKKQYRKAYIYLRAADLLDIEMRDMTRPHILYEKLIGNVSSALSLALPKKTPCSTSSPTVRIQRAVSGDGNIYFESLSYMAQNTVLIKDHRGISSVWFDALFDEAKKRRAEITVSYCPENKGYIDGIYFHASDTAFTMYAPEKRIDKTINCERFADKKAMADFRQKYTFAQKSRDSLYAEAYSALECAAKTHALIEEQYSPCTDYSITEKISKELCKNIFC